LYPLQVFNILKTRLFSRQTRDGRIDHWCGLKEVAKRIEIQRRNFGSAIWSNGKISLGCELLDNLAQWRARNLEFGSQTCFIQQSARLQRHCEDALAQGFQTFLTR